MKSSSGKTRNSGFFQGSVRHHQGTLSSRLVVMDISHFSISLLSLQAQLFRLQRTLSEALGLVEGEQNSTLSKGCLLVLHKTIKNFHELFLQ